MACDNANADSNTVLEYSDTKGHANDLAQVATTVELQ